MNRVLDSSDIQFLKQEIKQIIALYLAILIVGLVIISTIVFSIITSFEGYNNLVLIVLILTCLTIFSFFLKRDIKDSLADLKSGQKKIVLGTVQEKSNNTNYGWSGNIVADMRSQPTLVEYYLLINNVKYFVKENDFTHVNIDDEIEIHFSWVTNKLICVKKI